VHTNLVQSTLIGEDGDVPVIASASYVAGCCQFIVSINELLEGCLHAPDMMAAGVCV
jgi:hypothetical protein